MVTTSMRGIEDEIRFGDRETRSRALQRLAEQGLSKGSESEWQACLAALHDSDPLVREWAIVAVRSGGNSPRVIDALWGAYRADERENIRAYAIESLGDLRQGLPMSDLENLFEERHADASDTLLQTALRGFGAATGSIQALLLQHDHPNRDLLTVCYGALLRCAINGINDKVLDQDDLKDRSWDTLKERLGEKRVQQRIAEERARRMQGSLFKFHPDIDYEFDPSSPLSDNAKERFIQDLSLWDNLKIVQARLYRRDKVLAAEKKDEVGHRCMACGEATTTVDAHHVDPRGVGGVDTKANLLVVCPNCHRDAHSGTLKVGWQDQCVSPVLVTPTGELVHLPPAGDRDAAIAHANQRLIRRIVENFRILDLEGQNSVLEQLFSISQGEAK